MAQLVKNLILFGWQQIKRLFEELCMKPKSLSFLELKRLKIFLGKYLISGLFNSRRQEKELPKKHILC